MRLALIAPIWLLCIAVSQSIVAQTTAREFEKYALLIGVNKYSSSGLPDLQYAKRDVLELRKTLLSIGYRPQNVIVMTDDADDARLRPSQRNILDQLRRLSNGEDGKSEKNFEKYAYAKRDHVLIALSGHGVQIGDQSYFCPDDADINAEGNAGDPVADKRLIPLALVKQRLDLIPVGVKLLLCDACRDTLGPKKGGDKAFPVGLLAFSPLALFPNLNEDELNQPQATTRPKARAAGEKGVAGFFSCRESQRAYEDARIKHSWFFHFVIRGLQGAADSPPDGKIHLEELVHYVRREVSITQRGKNIDQMPVLGGTVDFTDPIAVIEARLVDWNPSKIGWKVEDWKQTGDIQKVDGKRLYPVIERAVKDPKTGVRLKVKFLLVSNPDQPYYMMENKVSTDLFLCFARLHLERLDRESPWLKRALAMEGSSLPAFDVSCFEAQAFAKWLGGKVPTREQWDVAAGIKRWENDGREPEKGPFQPANGEPDIAVHGKALPVGVALDDWSDYFIRDMSGNGMEWTSTQLQADLHFLRGWSYEKDKPLTFQDIVLGKIGAGEATDRSAFITFRVVLAPLK